MQTRMTIILVQSELEGVVENALKTRFFFKIPPIDKK